MGCVQDNPSTCSCGIYPGMLNPSTCYGTVCCAWLDYPYCFCDSTGTMNSCPQNQQVNQVQVPSCSVDGVVAETICAAPSVKVAACR
jgi:hypothetical protein